MKFKDKINGALLERRIDMKRLTLILLALLMVFTFSSSTFSKEQILSFEVIDSNSINKTKIASLYRELGYILVHHANSAEREKVSQFLKDNNGREVRFYLNNESHLGVLFRLPYCFGRGLLIYSGDLKIKRYDIIEIGIPEGE